MCLLCLLNDSDDLFDELRDALGKRARDREASVRVQAVIALARFQSTEDEAGIRVTKALIEILQHDPSAYHLPYKGLTAGRSEEPSFSILSKRDLPSYSSLNVREMWTPSTVGVFIQEV